MLTSIALTKFDNEISSIFHGYIAEAPQPGFRATIFIIENEKVYQLDTTPIKRLFIVAGTNVCYFETESGNKYRLERIDDLNGIRN